MPEIFSAFLSFSSNRRVLTWFDERRPQQAFQQPSKRYTLNSSYSLSKYFLNFWRRNKSCSESIITVHYGNIFLNIWRSELGKIIISYLFVESSFLRNAHDKKIMIFCFCFMNTEREVFLFRLFFCTRAATFYLWKEMLHTILFSQSPLIYRYLLFLTYFNW